MPFSMLRTRMAVAPERMALSSLAWCGSRCWMKTNAMPVSGGRARSSCRNASRPPAEAPIPATGKGLPLGGLTSSPVPAAGSGWAPFSCPSTSIAEYRRAAKTSRQLRIELLEHVPNKRGLPALPLGGVPEALPVRTRIAQPIEQFSALLQVCDSGPQRVFLRLGVGGDNAVARVCVPDAARVLFGGPILNFAQGAVAFGTREIGRVRWHGCRLRLLLNCLAGLFCQRAEECAKLFELDNKIDLDVRDGIARHVGKQRVGGILHHRDAAAPLDLPKADGAVVQRAAEHDADGAVAVCGNGSEQRIDGRTVAVLSGTARELDAVVLDQQVMIGRGDVNAAALERRTGFGLAGRERSCVIKNLGQVAGGKRRKVQNDEHRGGEIFR